MKTTNAILTVLNSYEELTSLDLVNSFEDSENLHQFEDLANTLNYQNEVIYYSVAIDYLKTNNPSLRDYLELAHNTGCTLENLNSETLATLLMQQKTAEILSDLYSELSELETYEDQQNEE